MHLRVHQRAFRSPFGNLRMPYLDLLFAYNGGMPAGMARAFRSPLHPSAVRLYQSTKCLKVFKTPPKVFVERGESLWRTYWCLLCPQVPPLPTDASSAKQKSLSPKEEANNAEGWTLFKGQHNAPYEKSTGRSLSAKGSSPVSFMPRWSGRRAGTGGRSVKSLGGSTM